MILRLLRWAGTVAVAYLCASHAPMLSAQTMRHFSLIDHSGVRGNGHFMVDDSALSRDVLSLDATSFEGVLDGEAFGYSIGSTRTIATYDLDTGRYLEELQRFSLGPAIVTFGNGEPVGIGYRESHSVQLVGGGCVICDFGYFLSLTEATWNRHERANDQIGTITFAAPTPIPEPSSVALMLSGLALVAGAARWKRPSAMRRKCRDSLGIGIG